MHSLTINYFASFYYELFCAILNFKMPFVFRGLYVQAYLQTGSLFLCMPEEFTHATALLNSSMLAGHVMPTPMVHQRLANVFDGHPCPLAVQLVATLVTYWGTADTEFNVNELTAEVTALMNVLLGRLESEVGRDCVGFICSYVACSRYGLSDTELVDLMSSHGDAIKDAWFVDQSFEGDVQLLWPWVKERLSICLLDTVVDGVPLTRWKHGVFGDVVRERYGALFDGLTKAMLKYFSPATRDSRDSLIGHRACALYRRIADEWPFQLFRSGLSKRLQKDCLFDVSWLGNKLGTCGLYEVFLDVSLAKRLDPSSAELDFLTEWLICCSSRLLQDPLNMCTYIYLATGNGVSVEARRHLVNVDRLLSAANERVLPLLEASGPPSDSTGESPTGLFRLKNYTCHMLSVSTTDGKLAVWNIYSRAVVRVLTGLDRPRDVNMSDNTNAVVLCDRHLEVYDLNDGVRLSQLKGVLSIKMPYYGIHDDKHVIALSRNRMCVNMMRNADGDVVATFKVGEDRFLDSLLVSANGKVCVCGDAVQKPFPLLVWDMSNRKLMHDLRIPGHEFNTRIAAISNEGHYVVCACKVDPL